MCCVGGNFTRKCCFRDPKFKHFLGGMPPKLPRRCRHFCFMVLAPLQPLQMSWHNMAFVPCIDMLCIYKFFHPRNFSGYSPIYFIPIGDSPYVTFNWCETAMKTKPSINLHYKIIKCECIIMLFLVSLFSFVLIFSKLSTLRNSVQGAKPFTIW